MILLSSVSLITGFSLGMEFISAIPEEDIDNSMIVDLGVLRLIFTIKNMS